MRWKAYCGFGGGTGVGLYQSGSIKSRCGSPSPIGYYYESWGWAMPVHRHSGCDTRLEVFAGKGVPSGEEEKNFQFDFFKRFPPSPRRGRCGGDGVQCYLNRNKGWYFLGNVFRKTSVTRWTPLINRGPSHLSSHFRPNEVALPLGAPGGGFFTFLSGRFASRKSLKSFYLHKTVSTP